jgi:hypothetical protein
MRAWLRVVLDRRRRTGRRVGIDRESDVAIDPHLANSRATGGGGAQHTDSVSTTGTGSNQLFVGRVSGEDAGAYQVAGAEVRAW